MKLTSDEVSFMIAELIDGLKPSHDYGFLFMTKTTTDGTPYTSYGVNSSRDDIYYMVHSAAENNHDLKMTLIAVALDILANELQNKELANEVIEYFLSTGDFYIMETE